MNGNNAICRKAKEIKESGILNPGNSLPAEPDRKKDFNGWLDFHKDEIIADYRAMGTVAWRKKWGFVSGRVDKTVRDRFGLHKMKPRTHPHKKKDVITSEAKQDKPQPGELCKTCAAYDECEMRDAAEFCGGYKSKQKLNVSELPPDFGKDEIPKNARTFGEQFEGLAHHTGEDNVILSRSLLLKYLDKVEEFQAQIAKLAADLKERQFPPFSEMRGESERITWMECYAEMASGERRE